MSGFFQVFYAIFSGILTSLAIPNELFYFGSPVFGMIALVPLYAAAKEAKSYRQAALLFGIDGLTTHLLSSFWLANFKDFAIFTLGASAAGTFFIEAMAGIAFFAPFAQKMQREKGKEKGRRILNTLITPSTSPFECSLFTVPWFACVRVFYEWVKSTGFLAYPWGTISMSAYTFKALAQSADIFGVYGITFLFAFISGVIAETITASREEKKAFFKNKITIHYSLFTIHLQCCAIAILACFILYGEFRLHQTREPVKTLNAVLIQQNSDPWASFDDTKTLEISMRLSQKGIDEFAAAGLKTDIVIWSEAVLRSPFPYSYPNYALRPENESLVHFIGRNQTPFLIGGSYIVDEEKLDVANSALVFDKEGNFRGYYGKTHLVPFAEAVPGTEYPFVRNLLEKLVGFSNGWTPGGKFTLFDVPVSTKTKPTPSAFGFVDLEKPPFNHEQTKVRFATPICFEDAFPDICGPFHNYGAEVFLNITDDSWSKTNSAEYQHFVVASFRAIEYRTTLVRSTNAGFTTVVDPCGRVLQSLPLFEENYLCARVPIYPRQETVYSRFTNWFVYLIMLFMLAVYIRIATRICSQLTLLTCKRNKVAEKRRQAKDLRQCVEKELMKIEF